MMLSRIVEIERNDKVQFEHRNVKTKQDSSENVNSEGKRIMLKCDAKSKDTRFKCEEEHKNNSACVRGDFGIKCRDRHGERKTSEVIKKWTARKI